MSLIDKILETTRGITDTILGRSKTDTPSSEPLPTPKFTGDPGSVPLSPSSSDNVYNEEAKIELSNNMKKLTDEGKSKEEAMALMASADSQLGSDPTETNFSSPTPTFLDDPNLNLSIEERRLAEKRLEESTNKHQGFMGNLKKRWDTSVKKNLDSLSNLAQDENYLKWLSALGLESNDIVKLSRGRESYIEDYSNRVKDSFNNDVAWMDNLDKIKGKAEKDYLSKVKIVNDEISRLSNKEDKVLNTQVDDQGNVNMIFRDAVTGQPYIQTFNGLGKKTNTRDKSLGTFTDENGEVSIVFQKEDGSTYTSQVGGIGKPTAGQGGGVTSNLSKLGASFGVTETGFSDGKIYKELGSGTISDVLINGKNIRVDSNAAASLSNIDKQVAALGLEGINGLEVGSHYRSNEQQAALYEKFKAGKMGPAAPPGQSNHNFGLAVDLPAKMVDNEQVKKIMNDNGWYQVEGLLAHDRGHFEFRGTQEGAGDQPGGFKGLLGEEGDTTAFDTVLNFLPISDELKNIIKGGSTVVKNFISQVSSDSPEQLRQQEFLSLVERFTPFTIDPFYRTQQKDITGTLNDVLTAPQDQQLKQFKFLVESLERQEDVRKGKETDEGGF